MASHDYYNAPLPPIPSSEPRAPKPSGNDQPSLTISPVSHGDVDTRHAQYPTYPAASQQSIPDTSYHGAAAEYYNPQGGYGNPSDHAPPYSTHDPYADHSAIPLQNQRPGGGSPTSPVGYAAGGPPYAQDVEAFPRRHKRKKAKKGWLSGRVPWVVYIMTVAQIGVFIGELVKNGILTGTPIQLKPSFNPMIGPSFNVLVNMGARFAPCMHNVHNVTDYPLEISWPCPNSTTTDTYVCTLSELCGFGGIPYQAPGTKLSDRSHEPNQWFRFILPIFLHAGVIHIGFNMLLQMTLGRDMERAIGSLRFALVYFCAGIFGFVLGGNYSPPGVASTGASGALFGIIALNLLDLFYTWKERRSPVKELIFILLDIGVSFVLGLLPGIDNFAHIGGFLVGLALGVCLLHSPNALRQRIGERVPSHRDGKGVPYTPVAADYTMSGGRDGGGTAAAGSTDQLSTDNDRQRLVHPAAPATPPGGGATTAEARERDRGRNRGSSFARAPLGFFTGRKPLWWAWWLMRAGALVAVLVGFILLLNNFYVSRHSCSWCYHLSCLPIKNWCELGYFTPTNTTTTSTTSSSSSSSAARVRRQAVDLDTLGRREEGVFGLGNGVGVGQLEGAVGMAGTLVAFGLAVLGWGVGGL